jgi:hypothetical protein
MALCMAAERAIRALHDETNSTTPTVEERRA